MKFLNSGVFVFTSLLILSSCTTNRESIKSTAHREPVMSTHETGMVVKPVVADLEINNEKQSVVYTADLRLPASVLNNNAMKLFMEKHKCDYIIDPVFARSTIIENSQLNTIEITLTGFPASYKKIYQVDELPQSVKDFAEINLPVKRTDYLTLQENERSGTPFGMEFSVGLGFGGGLIAGGLIDYAFSPNGIHGYFATELYSGQGQINLRTSFNNQIEETSGAFSSMSAFSIGAFKEKSFSPRFKIRGAAGLNFITLNYDQSIVNNTFRTSVDGLSNIGLRFGAGLDYSILSGVSIIGRAHANIGLLNLNKQSGTNTTTVDKVSFNDFPLVNLSAGLRFDF